MHGKGKEETIDRDAWVKETGETPNEVNSGQMFRSACLLAPCPDGLIGLRYGAPLTNGTSVEAPDVRRILTPTAGVP
jgi:hypothetical protein